MFSTKYVEIFAFRLKCTSYSICCKSEAMIDNINHMFSRFVDKWWYFFTLFFWILNWVHESARYVSPRKKNLTVFRHEFHWNYSINYLYYTTRIFSKNVEWTRIVFFFLKMLCFWDKNWEIRKTFSADYQFFEIFFENACRKMSVWLWELAEHFR